MSLGHFAHWNHSLHAYSAQYLSVLHSMRLLTSLIATPIAAGLVKHSLPLPFVVMVGISLMRYPLIWYTPETASAIRYQTSSEAEAANRSEDASSTEHYQSLLHRVNELHEPQADLSQNGRPIFSNICNLAATQGMMFCFMCFLVKRIAFTGENLMFQYVSELLEGPLSQTAWIHLPPGPSATLVTSVNLPSLFLYMKQRTPCNESVDVWAVRGSLCVLISGFVLFWASDQPSWMSVGMTKAQFLTRF